MTDTTTANARTPNAGTPLLELEGVHAGYGPVRVLGTRRSIYRGAPIYAAAIAPARAQGTGC